MNDQWKNRLAELSLQLPEPLAALGSYSVVTIDDDRVYVSGLGPFENGKPVQGVVGGNLSVEQGQHAARLTMLMILSCLDQACGLENIERCLRMTVYVRAGADFQQHPKVADGASELIKALFGSDKMPARSALGVHSLPMGIAVEIDTIFKLRR
ncbi:RidA family protein [Pseudomonas sp. NA-150]|uniref:RidA family protein n=1 Tax=Pseudomonas sp. NA-150 TaxID=3367525 RepID=UPI0037C82055